MPLVVEIKLRSQEDGSPFYDHCNMERRFSHILYKRFYKELKKFLDDFEKRAVKLEEKVRRGLEGE